MYHGFQISPTLLTSQRISKRQQREESLQTSDESFLYLIRVGLLRGLRARWQQTYALVALVSFGNHEMYNA